jgi:hypothetical protein
VPREKAGGAAVFPLALRCVPYVMPDHWAASPSLLAEELPGDTVNADPTVRRLSRAPVLAVFGAECDLGAIPFPRGASVGLLVVAFSMHLAALSNRRRPLGIAGASLLCVAAKQEPNVFLHSN